MSDQPLLKEAAAPLARTTLSAGILAVLDNPGVYIVRDQPGTVLYVGVASRVAGRIFGTGHKMTEWLTGNHDATVEIESYEFIEDARWREMQLITQYKPAYNTVGTEVQFFKAPPADRSGPRLAETPVRVVCNESTVVEATRRCKTCLTAFVPYRSRQRFCSNRCRWTDWNKQNPRSAQPTLPIALTLPSPPVVGGFDPRLPGEGRFSTVCEQCGSRSRRKREARFCSDACKDAYRHEKDAAEIELRKKERGMKGSAAKNSEFLELARESARRVLARDGDVDADRVRFELEARGLVLPSGGWWGSLFAGDEWTWTGRLVACKHKGSRARQIKVWRREL